MNKEIFEIIIWKYISDIGKTEKGKELYALNEELTERIYKAWGFKVGTDFENLVGGTTHLYAERMLQIGLAMGRNPHLVFDLPDSPHLKDGMEDANELTRAILDAARTKADSSPAYEEWEAKYNELNKKIEKMPQEVHSLMWEVVWNGLMIRGEAMFLLGWELRGNPDKLLVLPDAG